MIKKLLLTIAAVLCAASLLAQSDWGGVTGTVVNRAGRAPIAGAALTLSQNGETVAATISDAEGKIATAKSEAIADAEGKVNAAKTELQGKIDTVSGALDTYKTENNAVVALKANAADVYNKAEVEAMLTWGEF